MLCFFLAPPDSIIKNNFFHLYWCVQGFQGLIEKHQSLKWLVILEYDLYKNHDIFWSKLLKIAHFRFFQQHDTHNLHESCNDQQRITRNGLIRAQKSILYAFLPRYSTFPWILNLFEGLHQLITFTHPCLNNKCDACWVYVNLSKPHYF